MAVLYYCVSIAAPRLPPAGSTAYFPGHADTVPSRIFQHKHLLGIEGLQPYEIQDLLDRADGFVALNRQADKKLQVLKGLTQINLFFESSTRTQTSFELAGKRLGADVVNMAVASSAMKKGETLIDTAMTLNAMHPDVLVVRHQDSGAVALLARHVRCAVINAGDGAHEHPTQALLDALTIRRRKGRIEGLTVAICGDILHSRVARSNILLLPAMGARVRVVAPDHAAARRHRGLRRRRVPRHAARARGRRHRDDAAAADRAHAGQLRAVGRRVFPLLRPDLRQAARGQAGRADHAPGADEPRRRDRRRGGRRHRPQRHPGPGRDGRGRADGGARSC